MSTIQIDEDEFRRLLVERDRLRSQVGEIQASNTALLSEARIAKALAAYWQARGESLEANERVRFHERRGNDEALAVAMGRASAAHHKASEAFKVVRSYGVDEHGAPLPKAPPGFEVPDIEEPQPKPQAIPVVAIEDLGAEVD